MSNSPRIPLGRLKPELYRAMVALEGAVASSGLETPLLELVRTRASQINGCAFCVDMHTRDAVDGGETPHRLFMLSAWRESPFFTPRERAALALTEAETLLPDDVSDEVWNEAAAHFTDEELACLVWAIAAINTWNRVAVTTRMPPAGPPADAAA